MGLIFATVMLGLMASLSPATIVVFILVLATARPRTNAAAFLVGWGVSLVVVFSVSYFAGSSHSTQAGSGRTGVLALELLAGCALLGAGARQWRRRGVPSPSSDGWGSTKVLDRLNDLGPRGAWLVGVIKQPWAITTAAAIFLARHHAQGVVALVAFACFTVASTASVGLMYAF